MFERVGDVKTPAHLFAVVLLVLVLAVAFNAAIKWIERRAAVLQTGTRAGDDAMVREAVGRRRQGVWFFKAPSQTRDKAASMTVQRIRLMAPQDFRKIVRFAR
jgi:hypothetical protein